MSKFKGLVFESFKNPPKPSGHKREPRNSVLPEGKAWLAHNGRKQRLRNLHRIVDPLLHSKDVELQAAIEKVRGIVANEPEPEYGLLHILYHAKEASDGTGETVATCIGYMIARWEDVKEASSEV